MALDWLAKVLPMTVSATWRSCRQQRHQVLDGWNETVTPVAQAGGVHELVAARAAADPVAVAAVWATPALVSESWRTARADWRDT